MMKKLLIVSALVYSAGFALIFVIEAASGPVTPALALARAAAWPVYVTTGKPEGTRAAPYGEDGDE